LQCVEQQKGDLAVALAEKFLQAEIRACSAFGEESVLICATARCAHTGVPGRMAGALSRRSI